MAAQAAMPTPKVMTMGLAEDDVEWRGHPGVISYCLKLLYTRCKLYRNKCTCILVYSSGSFTFTHTNETETDGTNNTSYWNFKYISGIAENDDVWMMSHQHIDEIPAILIVTLRYHHAPPPLPEVFCIYLVIVAVSGKHQWYNYNKMGSSIFHIVCVSDCFEFLFEFLEFKA